MYSKDFETLINLVGYQIAKNDANYRVAIPVKERLVIKHDFFNDPCHSMMNLIKNIKIRYLNFCV